MRSPVFHLATTEPSAAGLNPVFISATPNYGLRNGFAPLPGASNRVGSRVFDVL
jgi:hypothetical protein